MVEHLYPALFAVTLWWSSTGLILYLDGLRRETFGRTLVGATVLLAIGLFALHASARDETLAGAYIGFTAAILVWGWIEVAFLTGFVTGPRQEACPPGARGWPRFRAAVAVILWHEIAILVGAGLVLAATLGGPNRIGLWTFLLLAVMRLSAKLNIFIGVRNPGETLLPDHLRYLGSYFARRPMNPLLPVSVAGGIALCAWLLAAAAAPGASPAMAAGCTLMATLAALAVLEHVFMVLPIPPETLWRLSLGPRRVGGAGAALCVAAALPTPIGPRGGRGAMARPEDPPPLESRT